MTLSLGISTCPNDTFIYEALIAGLVDSPFEWKVTFADVQTLNEMVLRGELDVAKVSAQIYPKIEENYHCLNCGGAIGYGCGPLLLSSKNDFFDPMGEAVLPGQNTTAALLFKFWYGHEFGNQPRLKFALFNKVYEGLRSGEFIQGVTIHEHRFTWKRDELHMIQDLGAYWEEKTGAPIPLGISVARREFSEEKIGYIEKAIRKSLAIARTRSNPISPFIAEKAQINDENVMKAHIAMFVNDFSEDVGEAGKRALDCLWTLSSSV